MEERLSRPYGLLSFKKRGSERVCGRLYLNSLIKGSHMRTKYKYRSAKTGHYVTEEYAKANPDTTVREAVKPRKK